MLFNDIQKAVLAPYASKFGGYTGLESLPLGLLNLLLSHPGNKVAVTPEQFFVTMPQVAGGYSVYDKNYQFKYSVLMDLSQEAFYDTHGLLATVPEMTFGYDSQDLAWIRSLVPGDHFYLGYTHVHPVTGERKKSVTLVVLSPVDGFKIKEPTPGPLPTARRSRS